MVDWAQIINQLTNLLLRDPTFASALCSLIAWEWIELLVLTKSLSMHAPTHITPEHINMYLKRKRHLFAIPLQPLLIIFVKEVDFSPRSLYLSVQVEKVQQRPCAGLPRSNDQTLRQLPLGVAIPEIHDSYSSHIFSVVYASQKSSVTRT